MNIYLENFIKKKFKKPGKVLDLGAGKLYDVVYLRQSGWECEGVDLNTGINLEKVYTSKRAPFDLVFSNYVLHFLKNKQRLIDSAYNNLKKNGWLFLHMFHETDKIIKNGISENTIKKMLNKFKNISIKIFNYYDNEAGHKHWHRIMEVTAHK